MDLVSSQFSIGDGLALAYREDGFVKLSGFLSPDLVRRIKSSIRIQLQQLGTSQASFSRVGYDAFDDTVQDLLAHAGFIDVMTKLTARSLV